MDMYSPRNHRIPNFSSVTHAVFLPTLASPTSIYLGEYFPLQ